MNSPLLCFPGDDGCCSCSGFVLMSVDVFAADEHDSHQELVRAVGRPRTPEAHSLHGETVHSGWSLICSLQRRYTLSARTLPDPRLERCNLQVSAEITACSAGLQRPAGQLSLRVGVKKKHSWRSRSHSDQRFLISAVSPGDRQQLNVFLCKSASPLRQNIITKVKRPPPRSAECVLWFHRSEASSSLAEQ